MSLWDCRTGLCIQTFYGHMNAVNSVAFNLRGDTIASTDADGAVKLWDVRMVAERGQLSDGEHNGRPAQLAQSPRLSTDRHPAPTFVRFAQGRTLPTPAPSIAPATSWP
eukprot:COSAG01_NODE_2605_length_7391_cov_6.506583_8_plen_109_part_00